MDNSRFADTCGTRGPEKQSHRQGYKEGCDRADKAIEETSQQRKKVKPKNQLAVLENKGEKQAETDYRMYNREPKAFVTLRVKEQQGEPQVGKATHYELPGNMYLGIYLLQVFTVKPAALQQHNGLQQWLSTRSTRTPSST